MMRLAEYRSKSSLLADFLPWAALVAAGVVLNKDGSLQSQKARIVCVAGNSIESPRLLLNSATGTHPNGLANSSGLVGRHLMMHPFTSVVGLFDEDLQSWQGLYGQHIYSLQLYETDESQGFVRRAKWNVMPRPITTQA